MSLSKQEILQYLVAHVDAPRPSVALPALTSLGASAVLIWRYYTFKHLRSRDVNFILRVLLVLNVWNLALTLGASRIFDLSPILRFLESHQSYTLVATASSELNSRYIRQDLGFIFIILVSTSLMNILAVAGLRCIEYLTFISTSAPVEPPKRHKKSVSFDENLLTFNYKEEMTLDTPAPAPSTSRLSSASPLIDTLTSKGAKQYMGLIVATLVLALGFLPSTIELNSSAIFVELGPDAHLRSDHIYFSLLGTFVIITFVRLLRIFNENSFRRCQCFPKVVSIISRFIWFYICAIVNFSLGAMVLSSDVFVNCLDAIINDLGLIVLPSTPMDPAATNHPMQFVTSILLSYLSHSSLGAPEAAISTCAEAACVQNNMLTSFASSYNSLNVIITNCWIHLNMLCFSLLPVLMWSIIDMKLCSLTKKSSSQV